MFTFKQHGNPKHAATGIMERFRSKLPIVGDWPSQIQDLHRIVIKWKELKTDIRIFVLPNLTKLDLFCKQGLDEISLSRHAKQVQICLKRI